MTTLYIKTHNVTGLKYFGKTIQKDFHTYRGSGTYWVKHINKHGYNVTTEMYAQFDEQDFIERNLLKGCALMFSSENNIVESKEWANLKPEDGLDGGTTTKITQQMAETRSKIGPDGLSCFQRAVLKGAITKETIEENGKSIAVNSALKAASTMSIKDENGICTYDIAFEKGKETKASEYYKQNIEPERVKKFKETVNTIEENGKALLSILH
jgi:hypothetical protein